MEVKNPFYKTKEKSLLIKLLEQTPEFKKLRRAIDQDVMAYMQDYGVSKEEALMGITTALCVQLSIVQAEKGGNEGVGSDN